MSGALPRTDLTPGVGDSLRDPQPRGEGVEKKFAPLSFSQQQLWYACQFQSGAIAYNQPVAWRLTGPLDVGALEQSVRAIVRRHEALRTTFPALDGAPVQCVHADLSLNLGFFDLRGLPDSDREARVGELVLEEARHPFDLANELLFRAALLRTTDQDYLFIITVHHIVCDGWSMGILIEELAQFYRAFSCETLPLQDPPYQYPDFSAWQRGELRGEKLDRQLTYWKQQLNDVPVLELPTDRPHPPMREFRGASQPLKFPAALTAAFKSMTGREEVFLFMGLLAALQILLHRYTGQTDIVVGAPVACRKRAKHQRSVGLFLNLVALRCDLSGDPTFRELLKTVRDRVMRAYQHQDLPFERVVEEVRPVRDPGRSPLFQVMLDQVDPRWIALDLAGLRAEWFSVDNQTSKFDLTLAWSDSPDGLRGWLEYDTDLFDADTIERMLGHYQTILESVAADPAQRISRIPILTRPERQQLLDEWNATEADHPAESCIHQLFEWQATRNPQAIAVQSEEAQLTWGELNRNANQAAHYLASRGVTRGSLVGVCFDRSCDLMVALLGVLKTGAAYVPLDPTYPQQRLAFMVQDSGIKTLLTQEKWADVLPKDVSTTIFLEREGDAIGRENAENLRAETSPDDPAYVIYTSGSTGQPKGVIGLHRGAVNRFTWMWQMYPFEPGEVACAKTSLSFVDSIWETFGALLAGIPTVLISEEVAKNPANLIATLDRHRVTRIVLVPSLLRAMLETEPDIRRRLPRLKYWISSGEALSADLVWRFRASLPDTILLNLYGSSEISADVTCFDTRHMQPGDPVLIGRPIANTQIYILDKNLQPAPVGVPGQLGVSGHGLARGYLARPKETAEKFVANPFRTESRLYLTGDLARYRRDGNIEYLGRNDHQVKIRGFRVELEDIEASLREHPSVHQAVVTALGNSKGECRLVAYIVQHPAGGGEREGPETADQSWADCTPQFRLFLQQRLPNYMVPAEFVLLKSLPLTPSGKIDRRALPEPVVNRPEPASAYVGPQTPTEHVIRDIWREVLHLENVGTQDNFFDLGGHSLLLAVVHRKLVNAFDREIRSTDLYQYPTIGSLASHLNDEGDEQRPLSPLQERARKRKGALLQRQSRVEPRVG